jgi:hypothetical protein
MAFSPLSISRRRVFGDIYSRCEPFTEEVPVYLLLEENELLGHADQSLGKYADAVTFHLADDVCKRLSSGQYTYEFDLDRSEQNGRVVVKAIFLKERKPYEKPLPARRASA